MAAVKPKRRARANGEGSVYRSGKSWKAVVTYYVGGKRRRLVRTHSSQREALHALEGLRSTIRATAPADHSPSTTFSEWSAAWLSTHVEPNCSPATFARYKLHVEKYLVPAIGAVRLGKLNANHLSTLLADLERAGVGDATRVSVYEVARSCLNRAVACRVIPDLPISGATKPKSQARQVETFSRDELLRLFDAVSGKPENFLIQLAVNTGMRQNELFGLRWSDFRDSVVEVRRQLDTRHGPASTRDPKSTNSIRVVPFPGHLAEHMETHRRIVADIAGDVDAVFVSPTGRPVRDNNWRRRVWNPLLKRAGVAPRTFHCLRHTFATQLLRSGVSVNAVSKILGHSSPSVTLNVYGHVLNEDYDKAAEAIAALTKVPPLLPPAIIPAGREFSIVKETA